MNNEHVKRKAGAVHALRINYSGLAVNRIGLGNRMQKLVVMRQVDCPRNVSYIINIIGADAVGVMCFVGCFIASPMLLISMRTRRERRVSEEWMEATHTAYLFLLYPVGLLFAYVWHLFL